MKHELMVIILAVITTVPTFARDFIGFPQKPSWVEAEYHDSIDRYIESDTEFKILLTKHAAFYLFPKTAKNSEQITKLLKSRIQNRTPMKIRVDAYSREIISMSDQVSD